MGGRRRGARIDPGAPRSGSWRIAWTGSRRSSSSTATRRDPIAAASTSCSAASWTWASRWTCGPTGSDRTETSLPRRAARSAQPGRAATLPVMRKALAILLAALAAPALAGAAELELTGYAGLHLPVLQPVVPVRPRPGHGADPRRHRRAGRQLRAQGLGRQRRSRGALTFYVTEGFGFEVRYDHADITVETQSSSYDVTVGLPAPLDPVVAALTLSEGTVDLNAVAPFSLNLKLRTGGQRQVHRLRRREPAGRPRGHRGADDRPRRDRLQPRREQHPDRDDRRPGDRGRRGASSWGGNLGLGLQIPLGEHAALVLEGRGFYFPKRTLEWEPVLDRPLSDIEKVLLDARAGAAAARRVRAVVGAGHRGSLDPLLSRDARGAARAARA